MMRKTNHEYAITCKGMFNQEFYFDTIDDIILVTIIIPTTFPNKKKAKRMLKKLNNKRGDVKWGIIDYNIWRAYCRDMEVIENG